MLKKTYPEFEALKKNNPWKFIFENQSDEDIRQHVVDWDWQFVHPKDKDIILNHDNDKKVKELNKFVLHKLPKPYRGNLKDPKLVILSLNPGFNDRVNRVLFNMLAPKYQLEFIDLSRKNLLLADGCRIITNELDDVLDNGYWTRQLSDIAEKNKAYLDKIGLMQYIPYASKNFESWEGADKLETQLFTQKIIHHLLNLGTNLHVRSHVDFLYFKACVLKHFLNSDDVSMTRTPREWRHTRINIVAACFAHLQNARHVEARTCVAVILHHDVFLQFLDASHNLAQRNRTADASHVLQTDFVGTSFDELFCQTHIVVNRVDRGVGDAKRSLSNHASLEGITLRGSFRPQKMRVMSVPCAFFTL